MIIPALIAAIVVLVIGLVLSANQWHWNLELVKAWKLAYARLLLERQNQPRDKKGRWTR